MKSILTSGLLLATCASSALATITIVTPWSNTTWTAGGEGLVTWDATGTSTSSTCDIQMMSGDPKNANLVAWVTPQGTPVSCSLLQYSIHPLNDFAAGKYSIRMGQASSNTWVAYSGQFTFEGNGTAKALQPATVSGAASSTSNSITAGGDKTSATISSSPKGKNAADKLAMGSTVMTVAAAAAVLAFVC